MKRRLSYADTIATVPIESLSLEEQSRELRARADAVMAEALRIRHEHIERSRPGVECRTCLYGPQSRGWRAPCCSCSTPGYSLWESRRGMR